MSPVPSPTSKRLSDYLASDAVVDHEHPAVRAKADSFRAAGDDPVARAEAAFRFVRDEVDHVIDARDPRVTWRASDVLRERVGICHAKAHLLAALLRAQGIPAGFCYQELSALHGLNAVHLLGKWVRLDARGNRTGARGEFFARRGETGLAGGPRARRTRSPGDPPGPRGGRRGVPDDRRTRAGLVRKGAPGHALKPVFRDLRKPGKAG
ncbi:transglutaminase family protein [Amycolatopsis sp. NPDC098790]|uniref:transglutaminase-like domain-containing protein n=1 Tax=Amycolatopsis sp. NPDC098790 TaxID=3363939 RepID=UPI003821AA9B